MASFVQGFGDGKTRKEVASRASTGDDKLLRYGHFPKFFLET